MTDSQRPPRLSDADVFYGSHAPTSAQPAAPPLSSPSDAGASQAPGVEKAQSTEASAAEVLFSGGGEVPSSAEGYEPRIASAFDYLEYQARYDKNEADIEELTAGREALKSTLFEFSVGDVAAAELVSSVTEYMQSPLSDEALEQLSDRTTQQLRAEWGPNFDRKLAGAQRVANEAMQRMPWLRSYLDAGAGNDPAVIAHFARIAQRKGWA